MENRGKFIVFEGIDGSGKSTQMKLLSKALEDAGIKVRLTLEPTYGMVGEPLHRILSGEVSADPRVTAALFVADRLDHILNKENGVLKTVEAGETVICDRYYFSSYAYQSVEVPSDWVVEGNRLCSELLRADCTIFIDISPKVAMERILSNRHKVEIYETEERLTKVRDSYFNAFRNMGEGEHIKIIDGERSAEEIAEEIKRYILGEIF